MIWRFLYHCIRLSLNCIAIPCFRFKAIGTGNIPATGAVLLASNHASYLDPLFIGVGARRRINYLAKKELFSNRVFRFILRTICGALPVDRDQLDRNTLREMFHLLHNDEILLVFPEGTRTPDGKLGEAKLGVGLIAYNTKATVVPVYIHGTFEIWPRNAQRIHFKQCRVIFGPPVALSDCYAQTKSKELYKHIGSTIMESIQTLAIGAA